RPGADKAEILSEVEMPPSKDDNAGQSAGIPEPIFGGAAISRGRIFFMSTGGVYAIGPKTATKPTGTAVADSVGTGEGAATWLQVSPPEVFLDPGKSVKLHARRFDAKGRPVGEQSSVTWAVTGLKGTGAPDGTFTAAADGGGTAGTIKATAGSL